MKLHRIYAMILRYSYIEFRDIGRLSDMFYWPVINLLLWGITSLFIQKNAPDLPFIILIIISGVVFWQVIWRGNMEITMNFLEEMWNKNLINLYSSPLRLSETVVAMIFMSIVKAFITTIVGAVVAFFLYKYNIFIYGFYLIPIMFLLLMSGWAIGFFIAGLVLRYGTQIQTLAWTSIQIIAPFSGVYYPISILPPWAQTVSKFLPTSYIFEAARGVISTGILDMNLIYMSFFLNIIYCAVAIVFLFGSMKKVLEKGLVKVF